MTLSLQASPVASEPTADVGVVGMAVMGSNLARNFASRGYTVAVFNRSPGRTRDLMAAHGEEGSFTPAETVADFVASLKRPRRVILMVKAGDATDAAIDSLVPFLEPGDIVVDGGNSHFPDTIRREAGLRAQGLHFVGAGISGGEEGALRGPAIMPGGPAESYEVLGPMLESIAAKVGGVPCCAHVGPDGAGHFVKMVHNGIEYAMMHAYGEGYELLAKKDIVTDVPGCFKAWSRGTVVRSWLLDLLVDALEDNPTLADVSDYTNDSGEGRWTVEEAIDNAVPMPVIAASLFARFASRQPVSPALQAVAALRGQFGGHAVMTVAEGENLRATAPESAGAKASPGQAPAAAKVAAKKTTTRRAAPKASPAH